MQIGGHQGTRSERERKSSVNNFSVRPQPPKHQEFQPRPVQNEYVCKRPDYLVLLRAYFIRGPGLMMFNEVY